MRIRNASKLKAGMPDEALESSLAGITAEELRAWVRRISVPRHYVVNEAANRQTADWIAREFQNWGYEVQFQGCYRNVIALPPLTGDRAILVGAHYDSVPTTPGADDNGSAVAAMLGCAKACAAFLPELPVVFAAFNCEEDGLLGSSELVADFLPRAGFSVECCHVLEMVGFASHDPKSQKNPARSAHPASRSR